MIFTSICFFFFFIHSLVHGYCIPKKIECKSLCRQIYGCNDRYPSFDCRYSDQAKMSSFHIALCISRCSIYEEYAMCANYCEQHYHLSRNCERYNECRRSNQVIIEECLMDCVTG